MWWVFLVGFKKNKIGDVDITNINNVYTLLLNTKIDNYYIFKDNNIHTFNGALYYVS